MYLKRKNILLFNIFLMIFLLINYSIPTNSNVQTISENNDKIKINQGIKIVTFNTIAADWADNVLGELGNAEAIVTGSTDIHTYTYTSADVQKVAGADIFIKMGVAGLEPNVDDLIDAANDINPDLYVFTLKNSTPDPNYGIALKYDPLISDINGHFWMSPVNARLLVKKICANLTNYDPTNQSVFESNRDTYLNELDELLWRIGNFSSWYYKDLPVVVMHPAFMYLFDLLEINRTAVVEKTEGIEPSAAEIAEIIDLMTLNNINIVVANPQHDDEHAIEIARQTSSKLAYLTPLLGVYSLESYIDMIDYDLCALKILRDPPPDQIADLLWLWLTLAAATAAAVVILLIWRYREIE